MCIFKKYSNIFGSPNEGVHSYRFLNVAIVDFVLTILGAIILTYLTDIPLVLSVAGLLITGEIFHYLFGVNTNTLKYLNLTCE